MAKVLISALGIGKKNRDYNSAKYQIDNCIYEETIIGNALTKHFKIDKNIVIGTKKSLWEELYNTASQTSNLEVDYEFYTELGEKITNNSINEKDLSLLKEKLENRYIGIIIEYGLNNNELMTNFELLMNIVDELDNDDEIFIDITNSFRSLSFYMFIILNFLQNVSSKQIKISYISYGMFEASLENNGITPVVNLNLLYEAIEWIKSASEFKKFANSIELSQLLPKEYKNIGDKLNDFSYALNLGYVNELKKKIRILYEANNDLKKIEGFGKFIISPVVLDITNRFKKYYSSKSEYIFLHTISKLFYDKHLYSSAYIFLQESIVVYFLEFYSLSISNSISQRNQIKLALSNRNFTDDSDFRTLSNLYIKITEIRNAIAHAINISEQSSSKKINYSKDFEKEFYTPIVSILNKNKDYKIL